MYVCVCVYIYIYIYIYIYFEMCRSTKRFVSFFKSLHGPTHFEISLYLFGPTTKNLYIYIYIYIYVYIYIYIYIYIIGLVVECSPMAQETEVQSLVESYQRLKKRYLILPCLTFSIMRYVSRVEWSNPGKGVVPFPTPRCSPQLWGLPTYIYADVCVDTHMYLKLINLLIDKI